MIATNRSVSSSAPAPNRRFPIRVLAVSLLLLFAFFGLRGVPAQEPQGEDNSNSAANRKAVQEAVELFAVCDDIDKLNIITPLQLTPAQLDQTILAITSNEKAYAKQYLELNLNVRSMAKEIHAVKKQSLAGRPVPQDFANRMTQLLRQRDQVNGKALEGFMTKFQDILSRVQQARLEQIVEEQDKKAGRVSSKAFRNKLAYYSLALVAYPRIVPLLKELRQATAVPGLETKGTEEENQ